MNNLRQALGQKDKKGFTLIELLIVIAILAVLATAVTLILNPAELLRQGRDSTRISDLGTLNSAIALYLADVGNPSITDGDRCTGTVAAGVAHCPAVSTTTNDTSVDGSGWVAVAFDDTSSGSPLSALPLDPVNDAEFFYVFKGDNGTTTYELNAAMESNRYFNTGSDDVESTDGGDDADAYEVGSAPGLSL